MRDHVANLRGLIRGDGCTSAPELWFHEACNEHDWDYTTHRDESGNRITRLDADNRFLKNMRQASPNWFVKNTLPFLYYGAVRLFGSTYWESNDE